MTEIDRAKLKLALARHYRAQRTPARSAGIEAVAAAMLTEDARCVRPAGSEGSHTGNAAFVAAQVRYIPLWVWAAQIALVALAVALASLAGDSLLVRWAVGLLASASVLVCVPTLQASRQHKVAELEYACRHNASSVLVARLIILGCSGALAVGLMVAGTSATTGLGALSVALWACLPYFASCAGALDILRRVRPSMAPIACVSWVSICCGALYAVGTSFPDVYGSMSLATWAIASALALAWLVREVVRTVEASLSGLDAFSPRSAHMAS